jgi:hypothetical protein
MPLAAFVSSGRRAAQRLRIAALPPRLFDQVEDRLRLVARGQGLPALSMPAASRAASNRS